MKPLVIIIALLTGIAWGLIGGLSKPKSLWWKIITTFLVALSLAATILPPIAAPLKYAKALSNNGQSSINALIDIHKVKYEANFYQITTSANKKIRLFSSKEFHDIYPGNKIIARLNYINNSEFELLSIESVNPLIYYSYIPMLKHKIKLINLHVPVAWVSVLAYLISMVYSIKYLNTRKSINDIKAQTAAQLGTLFAVLATLTGMIWAKYSWGSYWNWDPRETSIFVLLLIYMAYFALRSSIQEESLRARLSSVYLIIAFFAAFFLVFVMPRIFAGLHPGSAGDVTIGPALSKDQSMLGGWLLYTFGFSMMAMTAIFYWLFNISIRSNKLLKNRGIIK